MKTLQRFIHPSFAQPSVSRPQGRSIGVARGLSLLTVAASAWIVGTLQAETTSGSGGMVISTLPLTITTPGTYYLSSNLNFTGNGTAITVSASAVTIDLNGHTLTNTTADNSSTCISVANRGNVVVRNGTITTFLTGVSITSSSANASFANTVENVAFTTEYANGVILQGTGCRVYRCRFTLIGGSSSTTGYSGIQVSGGSGNVIGECDFAGMTSFPYQTSGYPGTLVSISNGGGDNFALNNRFSAITYSETAGSGSLRVRGNLSGPGVISYNITDAGSNN